MDKHIVIIGSNSDQGEFLEGLLKEEGYSAYSFSTGSAGFKFITSNSVHLLVLDLELKDIKPISLYRKLIREDPALDILLLSSNTDIALLKKFHKLGVKDFLSKPIEDKEFIARVDMILDNGGQAQARLAFGNIKIRDDLKLVYYKENEVHLSELEYKLLKYFLEYPEKVLSREKILNRIWGNEKYVEQRIVDVYIQYLRDKLELDKGNVQIKTRRGFGYYLTKV